MGNGETLGGWAPSPEALLRIYVVAGDRAGGEPLGAAILRKARGAGIKGATILPGIAGYGRSKRHGLLEVMVHDPKAQPMVVELADSEKALRAFLPALKQLDRNGRLATLERLSILSYHATGGNGAG